MRTYLAIATITTAVLATVATPVATSATPSPTALPATCRAMQQVPAYTIKWEDGSTSHIKSGKVLVRKAVKSSETRSDLRSQCRMLVIQYAADLQASNK